MVGVDVVVVPEADLYQGVVVYRICKIFRIYRNLLILEILLILSKAWAAKHATRECCSSLSFID